MFYQVAILCCVAATVLAAPTDVVPLEKQQPTVIPIISQSDELEPNGTYKYSYETGNGIKREEISYDKVIPKLEGRSSSSNEGGESDDSDEIHVQQGSYSYTAPDGTLITLRYIADENGFQAFGDHLPRAPQVSTSSAEKSGRALKGADSAEAASAPILAAKPESAPEAVKPVPETAPATSEVQPESAPAPTVSSGKAEPSANPAAPEQPAPTEAIEQSSTTLSAEPLSVTSEQAATSTASDQSTPVIAEQSTTTIAAEQSTTVAAEESSTASADQPASTSAAEQPVSTTIAEQSATTVNAGSNSAEAAEQPVPPSEQPQSTEAPVQSPEDVTSTTVSA